MGIGMGELRPGWTTLQDPHSLLELGVAAGRLSPVPQAASEPDPGLSLTQRVPCHMELADSFLLVSLPFLVSTRFVRRSADLGQHPASLEMARPHQFERL